MKGEPGALPLMQFALKDLFDAEQTKGGIIALTLSNYLGRGGIDEALERHANASLEELTDEEKDLARSVFSGLIEIGRSTQDTRRTALSNELIPIGAHAEAVKSVVQKLASARLITTDATTVTISHEKLIDAWPWLKKLVNENRDVIALQNEIAEDAKEWEGHARDSSYLYTGARLANAREKMEVKKLALSGLAQNFVETGIQMEESKRQEDEKRRQKELDDAHKMAATERRARLITNGVLVATIILAGLLSYVPVRNELWRQQAMKSEMVNIPTGDYLLGDDRWTEENPNGYLVRQTYPLPAFSIDSYPVTNGRYGLCLQAGICSRPDALPSDYENPKNAGNLVVNITAIDAAEFCAWLDMRLPREKEWELAVQKDAFQAIGPEALSGATNFYEITISPYNQNESEWTDLSKPPEVLTLRGGELDINNPFKAYMTKREQILPTQPTYIVGFRCAINK